MKVLYRINGGEWVEAKTSLTRKYFKNDNPPWYVERWLERRVREHYEHLIAKGIKQRQCTVTAKIEATDKEKTVWIEREIKVCLRLQVSILNTENSDFW